MAACFTCQRANFSFLPANVPINVPTCQTACQCFNLACQRVPNGVPIFWTFLLRNDKWNFYTLLLYKKFYIIIDIIVIHICICIVHRNCIILHFYTSCHIKEKCVDFFFLFCSLVRNENTKRHGFYTLQVTRVFSNFPQLKQLNKKMFLSFLMTMSTVMVWMMYAFLNRRFYTQRI